MWYNILMDRDLVKILGYGVDSFTFDEAVEYAYSHHGQIVTINPEMISEARKNKDFARADEIRAELTSKGIEIIDTVEGTRFRVF